MKSNEITLMLYTLMLVYVLNNSRKIISYYRKDRGAEVTFAQRSNILLHVLVGLLIATLFVIDGIYLRVILVVLAFYFLYISREKIAFSELGIYHNGKLVPWEAIKKWSFSEKGDLVVSDDGSKPRADLFPMRLEDQDQAQRLIREHRKK